MLYCMESLGRSYVEEDETYVLFEKVLIDYLPFANDNTELKVNDLHTKYFLALEELYSMSKSKDASDMNSEEKMADSLAWYKACGLIYIKEGNIMIGIYKITNRINNNSYIGLSTDIESRWK